MIFALGVLLCCSACEKWLNITPEDKILERDLFKSREGFITALNGIYQSLLTTDLYEGTLTATTFDILAQYYDCTKSDHQYYNLAIYSPDDKRKEVDGTWSSAYTAIKNINTLLKNCDLYQDVLGAEYYNVVKGEALALRALLHFEMFRIFGPIYSLHPEQKCIPYVENADMVVDPLLPANEVADKILTDLLAAETMLGAYDPIVDNGLLLSDAPNDGPNDLRYRNMRLNYYAVQALIARVALYIGDKDMALEYAENVIAGCHVDHNYFPWTDRVQLVERKDYLFSTEVLFGLYDMSAANIFTSYFANGLENANVLRPGCDPSSQGIADIFYEGYVNDFRLNQWAQLRDKSASPAMYFIKYQEREDEDSGSDTEEGVVEEDSDTLSTAETIPQYMIPIIRISEMYLIAAEVYSEMGTAEGDRLAWEKINTLRRARNVPDREYELQDAIFQEFRKEFIGEGQMFWYYKRRNAPTITRYYVTTVGDAESENIAMEETYYLFELPQDEMKERFQDELNS